MTGNPDALFQAALRHHQAGDLVRARDGYNLVLRLHPRHAHALHYLGIVTYQQGNAAEGIGLTERALKLQPNLATPHFNLGNMLRETGQAQKAERCYRNVLRLEPKHTGALNNLAVLVWERKALTEAEAMFRRLIGLAPTLADAHVNLGAILLELDKPEEAIATLRRATELAPRNGRALVNLGAALERRSAFAEAEASYRAALAVSPDDADAANGLGNMLIRQKRFAEALEIFEKLIRRHSQRPGYLRNHGIALNGLDRFAEAVAVFERGLALAPGDAGLHLNLGNALRGLERNADAAAAYRRSIDLAPDPAAYYNLALALRDLGEVEAALDAYGTTLALQPGHVDAWRANLSTLHYVPGLDPARCFFEHRRFAAAFAQLRRAGPAGTPDTNPERRLRIGYVSSDLRQHPVGRNMELLLTCHDRERFALHFYAGAKKSDGLSERFRALAAGWHDVFGLSDEAVCDLVRADGIDILVILASRFDRNRPLMALRRAAPVQITMHDPATSGLDDFDYLIADRHLVPRDLPERFTERVLRLPGFYTHAPPAAAPPAESEDDPARPFTFAAFCHPAKLGAPVLELWGGILARLPEARLRIAHMERYAEAQVQAHVRNRLCAAGAAPGQIAFDTARVKTGEHLARYRRIDVALDPFPFTGATSSFEALWMGVPVVTLAGTAMVGRWTTAMLHTLKLAEWVADTPARYAEIAVALAQDAPRRVDLRRTLRARVAASPICDGPRRARQIERLYRAVWRRWCARQTGEALAAPP